MDMAMLLRCIVAVVLVVATSALAAPEVFDVTIPGVARYHLNTDQLNWTQAHTACKLMNGYLAVLETHEQAIAMMDIMRTYGVSTVHVGFHDLFEERSYVTILNQPIVTMGFQSGAPNSSGSLTENCGTFSLSTYTVSSCKALASSMCQLRMWDDYIQVGSFGYYKVHIAGRPWSQAWTTCRQETSDLLVLRSVEEYDAVYAKFRDQLHQRTFHYGAHHRYANQQFYTIFDEPLNWSGFSQWAPGLPDGVFNENLPYLSILFNEVAQHGLMVTSNSTALPFICKHDLHRP